MCIVHRIIKDSETGLQAAIRFEFPPKKGITLPTKALMRGAFSLGVTALESGTSVTLTIAEKPMTREGRESFTERARRLERDRRTGAGVRMRAVEDHCLSPQFSAQREPMRMTPDQEAVRARRKDRKTISHGEKIVKLIPGDKLHNHGKHIRHLKGNLKRELN